jgi:stringent starvation protein B
MEQVQKTLQRHVLNGFFEWAGERGLTPMIWAALTPECSVPSVLSKKESAWFNVSPEATRDYGETEEGVFFTSRFGGVPFQVMLPWACVQAVRVKEAEVAVPLLTWPGEIQGEIPVATLSSERVEEKAAANQEQHVEGKTSWLRSWIGRWKTEKSTEKRVIESVPTTQEKSELKEKVESKPTPKERPKFTLIQGGRSDRVERNTEERKALRDRFTIVKSEK